MNPSNKAPGAGYASLAYAESLSEYGEPVHLPRSGGYLLKRKIPGLSEYDAMGCYPLFFCGDWAQLSADLEELPAEIISVSLVADPFGDYSLKQLEHGFDVVNPFKVHYFVDLERPVEDVGSRHHRKEAQKARGNIQIEVCKDPAGFSELWSELYGTLAKRHNIHGIRAFSRAAFQKQLAMPEVIVHEAFLQGELVGAQLFFKQGDVVHCHLGAVSDAGYRSGAFYALDSFSFEYFSGKARQLDLGGGAGLSGGHRDGLSIYKKGWSTETRPVYFCGRITDRERYEALASSRPQTRYFPAYREGEFK